MLEAIKGKGIRDLGSREFSAAYRSQLCKNLNVCDSWKAEACCKDNDTELNMELGQLRKERKHNLKELKCKDLEFNCNHAEIGPIVRLNCPKTCGLCKSHMRSNSGMYSHPKDANMQLDDALAAMGKTGGGWTLTPTMPRMTHTPTGDQSCFVDADGFDCSCHATMQRRCRSEVLRKELELKTETDCSHFFVCTHSNTCQSYKAAHCKTELALLKKLQASGRSVETC